MQSRPGLAFGIHVSATTEGATEASSGSPIRRSTAKRFKRSFANIAWLTGAAWLAGVANHHLAGGRINVI